MHRLATIANHLSADDQKRALRDLKVVSDLEQALSVSKDRMSQVMVHMISDMVDGLSTEGSALQMLPSFVYEGNTDVKGTFLALDLGGTNFRVIKADVEGGKIVNEDSEKYVIPAKLMKADSSAEMLFDFIADGVAGFLEKREVDTSKAPVALGFTFSFPVRQTAVASGTLISWTKGFATQGVENQDVVELLRGALKRKNVTGVNVSALVNDTVGTLVTGYFADKTAEVGVILGTGTNACYWESVPNIPKLPSPDGWHGGSQRMCINMEWGNFDSINKKVLPFTSFDDAIDTNSPNPGKQRFEKMMSGMYLGEIAREVVVFMIQYGVLPIFPSIIRPGSLSSHVVSQVVGDEDPQAALTAKLFNELYGVELKPTHAGYIRRLLTAIVVRSARLAAAAVAAVLVKAGRTERANVCIDGSVFEKVPGYKTHMEAALAEALGAHGIAADGITLSLTHGGSGYGAAFIAALAEQRAGDDVQARHTSTGVAA